MFAWIVGTRLARHRWIANSSRPSIPGSRRPSDILEIDPIPFLLHIPSQFSLHTTQRCAMSERTSTLKVTGSARPAKLGGRWDVLVAFSLGRGGC